MDLRSNQIKDTYGNLLTVGTSAGSPTTGTVENGQGSDITSLTVNGTLNATDVSATNLSGYGTDISGTPNARMVATNQSMTSDVSYLPAYGSVDTRPITGGVAPTDVFELINSGVSGTNGARLQIKETGIYLVNLYTKISGVANNTECQIILMDSFSTTGMASEILLMQDNFHNGDITRIMTHMLEVATVPETGYYITSQITLYGDDSQLDRSELQIMRLSPRSIS